MDEEEIKRMMKGKIQTITVTPIVVYISKEATKELRSRGKYVGIEGDPKTQTLKVFVDDIPSPRRYVITDIEDQGVILRDRGFTPSKGMELGIYVKINHDTFQHVNHVKLED